MRYPVRYLVPLVCAAILAGCGLKQSYTETGTKAKQFHDRLSAGQFDAIWADTAGDLRKETTKEQFTALLGAVNRKLGKVVESKQTFWNSNSVNGVSTVTIDFDTRFERGTGKESIAFRWVTDDRLALSGYNIDSKEMLIN